MSPFTAFRERLIHRGCHLYRLLLAWLAGGPAPTDAAVLGEPPTTAPADLGLEARALSLQVFVDGLAVQALMCPSAMDASMLRATLRAELERLALELNPTPIG